MLIRNLVENIYLQLNENYLRPETCSDHEYLIQIHRTLPIDFHLEKLKFLIEQGKPISL